ncbi:MAG: DUF1549 domain-containing protein, partial [Planctomycetota bacterium]
MRTFSFAWNPRPLRVVPFFLAIAWAASPISVVDAGDEISFADEVRPILSDHCYHCHGPDEESREAGLRLDTKDDLLSVVDPEDPDSSDLLFRVLSDDGDLMMPPPESGKPLSGEQLAILVRWVKEGAAVDKHWAFVAPVRPAVPPMTGPQNRVPQNTGLQNRVPENTGQQYPRPRNNDSEFQRAEIQNDGKENSDVGRTQLADPKHHVWGRNPIDAFVLEKMRAAGLAPQEEADPATLLRRMAIDLTGLPPSEDQLSELAEQVQDIKNQGHADVLLDQFFDRQVERLLDSPHFGERWARLWLDAARYADSDGYEKDKPRIAWFYRDWVIRSMNDDRPYDDFIIRQIAGDQLPNATQDDIVATGFLRNSMVNEEGGADPEQFRMEAMFDRMDAIGKSVLGLTVQCAQCHTHKYDPIEHHEYYGLFAFLNNTHDGIMSVFTPAEQTKRSEVLAEVDRLEIELKTELDDWKSRLRTWADRAAHLNWPAWETPKLVFLDTTLGGQKFLPQA